MSELPDELKSRDQLMAELRALRQRIAALEAAQVATERQQLLALQASEERNRAIVAALPDLLFHIDADGRFLDCQTQYPEQLLVPPDQVVGRRVEEILPPDLAVLTTRKVQETLTSGALQVYEYTLPFHGEERHFEARMTVSGASSVLVLVRDVTEQVRTEEALRVSLEKYHVLFESFPLGITVSDPEGKILEANQASERLLGITMLEQQQRRIDGAEWRILRLDGTPLPAEEYASVRALREQRLVENVEMGVVRADGQVVWINATAAPIPLAGYGVAVTYSDITEQVRAQQALKQERDFSRALTAAAAVVSQTLDPDEVLDRLLEQVSQVLPNDAANIMLIGEDGRARIVRQRGYAYFGAEDYVTTAAFDLDQIPLLRKMAVTGEPLAISDVARCPEWVFASEQAWLQSYVGAPIALRGVTIGFLNIDSSVPGFFTPLHTAMLRAFADHTAVALENAWLYRAAQQELAAREQAEAALRESAAYLRAVFEQASDAIFINREDDHIIDVNRRACELLGYTREELLALTVADLQAPEVRRPGPVIKSELAYNNSIPFEGLDIRKDGTRVPVEITTSPLRIGKPGLVLSIVRDITERKAMETMTVQLRRQEQLAAIGQLAAGIAHDFRNLLTTIILYAQMGQRRPDLPPAVARYFKTIIDESRKATDLVQQMLDFGSRAQLALRPLDLTTFVAQVLTILQRTIPENIHITLAATPGPFMVEADAGRLQQVLTNLALNARDAMLPGGELCIGLERWVAQSGAALPLPEMAGVDQPPAWICLSVADTGIGMSETVQAHLFEPFFTTKEPGKGTGLGLAQVYGIIRQHKGHIAVTSQVGQGTTFRIYLPASVSHADQSGAVEAAIPPGEGEIILLVEDNDPLREAGQEILAALGYRVLTATNGRAALALYQATPNVALVITDLVMPEMGGRALLEALHRLAPTAKVLVVTGHTTEESTEALRAMGFLDVVRKPFDAETLAQTVRRVLVE